VTIPTVVRRDFARLRVRVEEVQIIPQIRTSLGLDAVPSQRLHHTILGTHVLLVKDALRDTERQAARAGLAYAELRGLDPSGYEGDDVVDDDARALLEALAVGEE
jgi:uncharacterized protein (DUF2236 family)